jgi:hypothetical protein
MLNGHNTILETRLKEAEEAEREVNRLQPLASEAPALRDEMAKAERIGVHQRTKNAAMTKATDAVSASSEKQTTIPELLGNAARAVNKLYGTLVEIENRRQEAMQSLAVADRMDYEMELVEGEEHERSLDRDPRGLAYALASRHGDIRVRKLLEELQPGFELLGGCNLDEPVYRDVANFVMQRVTRAAPPTAAASNSVSPGPDRGPIHESEPPADQVARLQAPDPLAMMAAQDQD